MKSFVSRTLVSLFCAAGIASAQESLPTVLTADHGPNPFSSIAATGQTSANCPFGVDPALDTLPEIITYLQSVPGFDDFVADIFIDLVTFTSPPFDMILTPAQVTDLIFASTVNKLCARWEDGVEFPGFSPS